MPSIAFSLICAIGLAVFVFQKNDELSLTRVKITVAILTIILAFYTSITFKRNFDWYDNFTLFSKDATVTKNSAKLENSLTSILLEKAGDKDLPISERELLCKKAIIHGTNAVSIHPSYHIAWLLYGNAYFLMGGVKEYEADSLKKNGNITANLKYNEALNLYGEAFRAYKNVRIIRPIYEDVSFNLVEKYRIRGNLYGKINKIIESIKDFESANISAKEKNIEVLRLLASAYGIASLNSLKDLKPEESDQFHRNCILTLNKAEAVLPKYVLSTISSLEKANREMAKEDKEHKDIYLSRAEELAQKLKAIK
jgi:tetratricopeptide (TPR) repeat protein